jgi:hypothetical protein
MLDTSALPETKKKDYVWGKASSLGYTQSGLFYLKQLFNEYLKLDKGNSVSMCQKDLLDKLKLETGVQDDPSEVITHLTESLETDEKTGDLPYLFEAKIANLDNIIKMRKAVSNMIFPTFSKLKSIDTTLEDGKTETCYMKIVQDSSGLITLPLTNPWGNKIKSVQESITVNIPMNQITYNKVAYTEDMFDEDEFNECKNIDERKVTICGTEIKIKISDLKKSSDSVLSEIKELDRKLNVDRNILDYDKEIANIKKEIASDIINSSENINRLKDVQESKKKYQSIRTKTIKKLIDIDVEIASLDTEIASLLPNEKELLNSLKERKKEKV